MEIKNFASVIKNNNKNALLLEGVNALAFKNATIVPASINSAELGILPGENGLIYPTWLTQLIENSKKNNNILIIDGLNKISTDEQEKFYGILKYKGVNGYKFPNSTKIILTIKANSLNKISKKILDLVIIYK